MSTILNVSIFPTDKGESVSGFVARAVKVIQDSGLAYQTGPMSTAIEGEWDEAISLLNDCYRSLEPVADRIYIQAAFDCRKGPAGRMDAKLASLKKRLDEGRY